MPWPNDNAGQPAESSADPPSRGERFPDLRSAGRDLALELEAFRGAEDVIVLGIVLGGVLVALEVAEQLGMPLDFVIIRRLLTPQGPGSQICAVHVGGSLVVDPELPPRPAVPESPLDYFVADALAGLARRAQTCRGERAAIDLARKTVILVDCGVRTGLTMRAAIRALRTQAPARIVAAVPVAALESRTLLEGIADDVVCLAWRQPFGHTGLWYADFRRPGDEQVSELIERTRPN